MKGFMRDDSDVIPPPSLTVFLRLQKLWKVGGLFADFSLWFVNPVPDTARGFAVGGDGCGPGEAWRVPPESPFLSGPFRPGKKK